MNGGQITSKTVTRETIPPKPPTIVIFGDEAAINKIVPQISAYFAKLPQAFGVKTVDDTVTVVQPQNASGPATINKGADGSMSSTIPGSTVPKSPAPPSPASKALGFLVYVGAAILIAGAIGVVLHYGFITSWGGLIPVGICVLTAGGGAVLILYATVLANSPWWYTAIVSAGVLAAGVFVALHDNWQKMFGLPVVAPKPAG